MDRLPDHYEALELDPKASLEEIVRAYRKRSAELRASLVEDAPEELAEVEAAYATLNDAARRTKYDDARRREDAEEDRKYAELDAELHRAGHHPRRHVRRSGGWLDGLWALLNLFR